jgi:hypothetical protein
MYNTSDFADFVLGMTAECENSLTRPPNDISIIDGNFNKINVSTDCTTFLLNSQCEDKVEELTLMVCLVQMLLFI